MNKEQLNQKLFEAVKNKDIKEVITLIEEGVDVNAKEKDGWTALMYAAGGSLNIVKLLIESGANVNMKDENGWTALMEAAKHDFDTVIPKLLIKKGANVNEKTTDSWTALMIAAEEYSYNVIKLLIEKGANLNIALTLAKEIEEEEIIELLKEYESGERK